MKDRALLFLAMLLVAVQLCISSPIAVWSGNEIDFSVQLEDALNLFYIGVLMLTAILSLVSVLIPLRLVKLIAPLFLLVSILVYVQQNILVSSYGLLDGGKLENVSPSHVLPIDLCIWILGLLIYLIFRKKVYEKAGVILIFSASVTAISIAMSLATQQGESVAEPFSINESEKFSFSKNKNVIMFILDGFQSDLFWGIVDRKPELKEELDGFKFYPNTTSVFAKTYPSIPLLLTGRVYRKEASIQDFVLNAYEDSLLTDMVEDGWNVGLYPYVKSMIIPTNSIMSNYVSHVRWSDRLESYILALNISFFRAVPSVLKNWIYNDGDFILAGELFDDFSIVDEYYGIQDVVKLPKSDRHQGISFLKNMKANIDTDSKNNVMRFYHLNMPHEPFLLDQNLQYRRAGHDFDAYYEYSIAAIKLMVKYLKELKEHEIYDNSAIIIVADHGGGEYTDIKYEPSSQSYVSVPEYGSAIASGKPLLLVKNFDDSGHLEISRKPVSLIDVAPTIAAFSGIEEKYFEGISIKKIPDNMRRQRTYYYYKWAGNDSRYLDDFSIYTIDGDANEDTSWSYDGTLVFDDTADVKKTYDLGEVIRFGSDPKLDAGYMNAFLVGGGLEKAVSHATSRNGRIHFSIPLSGRLDLSDTYVLNIELSSGHKPLDVMIKFDEYVVSSYRINKTSQRNTILIDGSRLHSNELLDVVIEVKEQDIGKSELIITRFSFEKARLPDIDLMEGVVFSKTLDENYLSGFWGAEMWGRWTAEKEASFYLRSLHEVCQSHYLNLGILRFFDGVNPDSLAVLLNGKKLDVVSGMEDGSSSILYDCSRIYVDESEPSKITISVDKVVSPSSISDSGDSRTLGMGLKFVKFVAK